MFPAVIIYLCIPLFLFLFTFLNLWFTALSAVLLVVLVCCVWHTQAQQKTPLPRPLYRYWPLLLIVTGIVYGGIWSPFNYWDWQKHFAIFNLLHLTLLWLAQHYRLVGRTFFCLNGLG